MNTARHLSNSLACAVVFLVWLPLAAGFAGENKKYLSKTTIDTLIQQAFVNLSAAADNMPSADRRQRQAITDARKVLSRLRNAARGDPNEKYVLWKTGELEGQIFLEERELVLKDLEKRQKERNAIIGIFNAELGKKRPDFIILKKACDDMQATDHAKARELHWSMEQRSVNISREIVYTLEKSLITGDLEKTQREFNYCTKNRSLLKITESKFGQFESRIPPLGEAIKLKPSVDETIQNVIRFFPQNRLSEAWKGVHEIEGLLARMERGLPQHDKDDYAVKLLKLIETINHKEDSLVAITYSILSKKDENAALDHLERVLKPCGVSPIKLGRVNMSIMNIAAFKKKSGDAALGPEMPALSNDRDDGGIDFALVRQAAKKKAQQRADSARAAEEEKARFLRIEQERVEKERQAAELKARRILQENQENADAVTIRIYTLLEDGKLTEARDFFSFNRKTLEQFLLKDAFSLLESTIAAAAEPQPAMKQAPAENAVNGIPSVQNGDVHETGRNGDVQESEESLRRNHEKARQVTAQIYGMLESNNTEAAYKRFCQVRRPLEKYLDREAFVMLQTTIEQSYAPQQKKR